MDLRQIKLVQESWQEVLIFPDAAAQLFYVRLFALDPSLSSLLKGDIREQGKKLIAMITVAVNGLGRIETLVPVFEALGRRHSASGAVAEALVWMLQKGLGKAFTPETREAWQIACGMLEAGILEAA